MTAESLSAGTVAPRGPMPDDLHALRAVVEGTAAGTGRDFFRSLVCHLAEAIDVQYATVCEFLDPPRGRVLAIWEKDHIGENLDFDYTTSPAARLRTGEVVHFPSGVLKQYPRAEFLAARHADAHMGVPFGDRDGRPVGFLSVFDERPMPEEPRRLFIMQIFAARAPPNLSGCGPNDASRKARPAIADSLKRHRWGT